MSVVLEAKNVTYRYGEGTPFETAAVEDVSFAVEQGELVGVIGHTGSGKSTLIQHFNGLLRPTSGTVLLDGEDIWADQAKLRSVRFRVGLCFQYPEYQLFFFFFYADMAFGPKNMGLDEAEIDRRVRRAAQFVGLKESYFEKSPFDLSGGEKRRAAIAGVMAMEPEVLILDEPTAGLDPRGRDTILGLIREYQRETGSTILLVSHSMEDVAKLATKVLVMNRTHLAMYGPVPDVYSRGEELVGMGLNVPQVTRIFMELKKRGYAVSDQVYTVAQGREELMRLRSGEGVQGC